MDCFAISSPANSYNQYQKVLILTRSIKTKLFSDKDWFDQCKCVLQTQQQMMHGYFPQFDPRYSFDHSEFSPSKYLCFVCACFHHYLEFANCFYFPHFFILHFHGRFLSHSTFFQKNTSYVFLHYFGQFVNFSLSFFFLPYYLFYRRRILYNKLKLIIITFYKRIIN